MAASIFTDFLAALGVPHTTAFSDNAYRTMTFQSLFGFSKLLESYSVPNEAVIVPDKADDLDRLPVPFLARVNDTFVIVTRVTDDLVVCNDGYGNASRSISRHDFLDMWSGVVLVAYPGISSAEPCLCKHRLLDTAMAAKRWILIAAFVFIFLYLFISNGIYSHVSTVLLTVIFAIGLYMGYHLELKSLNIHSDTADSICGIIDRSGCHAVLSTKAAKFFGLFGWSEVGIAYFAVSLGCLLIFPQYIGYLALINACCCPFSFWSVWYQKYRAKSWCTMCLISQACLWSALLCFIFGGWFNHILPLGIELLVLVASYIAVLLAVNSIAPAFDKNIQQPEEK